MPTVKIELPAGAGGIGETVEVDLSAIALPDGYSLNTPEAPAQGFISQAFAEASLKDEMQKRLKGLVDRGKAADDPALVKAILDKHGKGIGVDLDAHRRQWEEESLKPLSQKHEAMLRRLKAAEINEAARKAGVKDEYLDGGDKSFVFYRLSDQVEHDDDLGFVATQGGRRLPGREGRPFASAGDLMETLKRDEGYKSLFREAQPQTGGGSFAGGSKGGGARTFTREEIRGMSPAEFAKNEPEISRAMAAGQVH